MKNLLFILILLISAFVISCDSTNKPAKGFEDEIIVVADSVEYEQIVASLQLVFEKEIYTPQPEKLFTLKRMSVSQLEKNQRTGGISKYITEEIYQKLDSLSEDKGDGIWLFFADKK